MTRKELLITLVVLAVGTLCMAQVSPCPPDPPWVYPNVIVNGGFEDTSMGLTGWTVVDQQDCSQPAPFRLASEYKVPGKNENTELPEDCFGSWYVQTGFTSPMNGFPVSPPPQCDHAAMTDMSGPGIHVMYQDVTVPAIGATLSFYYYFPGFQGGENVVSSAVSPTPPVPPSNDFFRVDLMTPASDPFDVGPGVIETLLYFAPCLPLSKTTANSLQGGGYQFYCSGLSTYAGKKVRLRFMESDTVGPMNVGVDDVHLVGSGFDEVFWDDHKKVALCIDSYTGAFHWNVRSCKQEYCPWSNWSGVAQVVNTGTLFTAHPTDPFGMYFLYDILRHSAQGYFYTNEPTCGVLPRGETAGITYSSLVDSNTLKGPKYCPEACNYGLAAPDRQGH